MDFDDALSGRDAEEWGRFRRHWFLGFFLGWIVLGVSGTALLGLAVYTVSRAVMPV